MQAHLATVLKGVVKDKSKGALSRLLGERAAASALLAKMDTENWHARIGIVLVDDARLRSYTPRAAVEWALRYETDLGLECTRGGTWFSQQPGSSIAEAEAYVSRTAIVDREAELPPPSCWSRAPEDRKVASTAGETRHMLRTKAEGWSTLDFKGTKAMLRSDVLASDGVASSPFGVDVGPDAILASLGAYHATYDPAEIMIQDVVVGSGDDRGLFAARRTMACAAKGEENLDSDRELVFGEIAADGGAPRLRYARSIFNPEASVRRPATLPTNYPQASVFSNFANLYKLRTTNNERPEAEPSPGAPQAAWIHQDA